MEKPPLTIVTGNPLKFEELSFELSKYFNCEQRTMPDYHEIQGTPEEILLHKVKASYNAFLHPVLVDDTSFHIDTLGGFPGPYMKDFTLALGIEMMGKQFEHSKAKASSYIGLAFTEDDIILGQGSIEGSIVTSKLEIKRDSINFDPIFLPQGYTKTFADMTREEKNDCSHRGRALQDLMNKLQNRN